MGDAGGDCVRKPIGYEKFTDELLLSGRWGEAGL